MTHRHIPPGATLKGQSPTFTEETVPDALRKEHALAPGRWGVLHLLTGSVCFVDLVTGRERRITAPDQVIIAPEVPHTLRLDGPLSCRIDFFQEVEGTPKERSQGAAARD